MENKKQAFPVIHNTEPGDNGQVFYNYKGGFCKHEIGALMIAQGLATNSGEAYSFDDIARDAYLLAGKVLDQFKNS